MYGIINKAIEEMVVSVYGKEKLELIKQRSGIQENYFITMETYDDTITFQLLKAITEETGLSETSLLQSFGQWWVIKTGKEKYSKMMEAGGETLREFLLNLPAFHNRIMLFYPKMTPPEFKLSHIEQNSLFIHYYSSRKGLLHFVEGILMGLGQLYNTHLTIELIQSKKEGFDHDIFKVNF